MDAFSPILLNYVGLYINSKVHLFVGSADTYPGKLFSTSVVENFFFFAENVASAPLSVG